MVRLPTVGLRQPGSATATGHCFDTFSWVWYRYEGIVLVDQKWVVGSPSPDDKTDSKKLDKMTVAQIIAKGSKASGVKMTMGREILHFRAGD